MLHAVARTVLSLFLAGSLAVTGVTLYRVSQNPALTPFIDRTTAEITAATDRLMAAQATPARITERLNALLAEPDHNWIAIDALLDVAAERGLPLAPDLAARLQTARDADTSLLATASACAACAYDPAQCTLSATLICQAPMALTPLGDLAGITLEATNYATGAQVDQINLTLSLVGLAATGMMLATGGTSATVKIGASTAKLARRMGLISPRLTALMLHAAKTGVNWAALPAARSMDDLAATLRPAILRPVTAILSDAGRIAGTLPPTQTLHLIRYIDDATDARHLANATQALGPKTIGRIEVLGKSRLLRATAKYSNTLWHLATGIIGLILGLAGIAGNMVHTAVIRSLRRAAQPSRPHKNAVDNRPVRQPVTKPSPRR